MADPREHPVFALSVIAGLSGVLLCSCSPDMPNSRGPTAAMSSARLVERAPDAPYLPSAERFEAQVQATLETAFGYTGIVDTRCTDLSGTCLVDFEDEPTEVVSVTHENVWNIRRSAEVQMTVDGIVGKNMGAKRVWMPLAAVDSLISGCTSSSQGEPPPQPQSPVASQSASGEWARIDPDALAVSKVLSGDALRVTVNGDDVEVAIIGIKAPRVDAVDAVEQCLGKLSTAHLRDKEAGGGVRLFYDPSQSRTDDKGRRFAHVRLLATGTQAGAEQLRAGYAETIHRGDYHKQELNYGSDENEAKQSHAGIWDERLCRPPG